MKLNMLLLVLFVVSFVPPAGLAASEKPADKRQTGPSASQPADKSKAAEKNDGPYSVGGDVSQPEPIYKPEPPY